MLDINQIKSFYPENAWPFKRNMLREYLQYKILEAMYGSNLALKPVFMGGTCIHMVHASPRFSEDLDFDNPGMSQACFENMLKLIKRELEMEGCAVELKMTFKGAFRGMFRFSDILFESGLSGGHRDEKLLIRVDAEPQRFEYVHDKVIINRFDVLTRINAVPADMLLAQKLLCVFTRKRTMGRDFFDILFLMGKTKPNYDYLHAKRNIKNKAELLAALSDKCRELDFRQLARDIEPFVVNKREIDKIPLFEDYVKTAL